MTKQSFESFFSDLKNDTPYLKMALEGFSGTGKTLTSVKIALGLHKQIGSTKPIIAYDTERAFRALGDEFQQAGVPVKIRKSRSLKDLETAFDACEAGYSDILIIDSITHVWENFKNSYLANKSERLNKRVTRFTFQDWGYLKPEWKRRFSDRVVNGGLHVIFTGRAGYEYDHEEDEETGKMTELRKTGIKMKAETETAYEPDVLVLMERVENLLGSKKEIYRTATILKDRYRVIDGKVFRNPAFSDFAPMIDKALDGEYVKEIKENEDTFEELNRDSENWKKRKDVAIEEIEATITQMGLGTSKEDKAIKVDLIETAFLTKSWTKVQSLSAVVLEDGAEKLTQVKNEWLAYIKQCNAESTTPDKKMIYTYINQVFDVQL